MEPRNHEGAADRPRPAEGKPTGRVIVIGPYVKARRVGPDAPLDSHAVRDADARIEEAAGLARAIDLEVVDAVVAPVGQIRPATYLGKGKVEEFSGLIASRHADQIKSIDINPVLVRPAGQGVVALDAVIIGASD